MVLIAELTDTRVTEIGLSALVVAGKLAAPMLLTALCIGLLVGIMQSATQLQEPTIAFVPKFIGVGVVLLVSGNWMLSTAVDFTREMFHMIPSLLG